MKNKTGEGWFSLRVWDAPRDKHLMLPQSKNYQFWKKEIMDKREKKSLPHPKQQTKRIFLLPFQIWSLGFAGPCTRSVFRLEFPGSSALIQLGGISCHSQQCRYWHPRISLDHLAGWNFGGKLWISAGQGFKELCGMAGSGGWRGHCRNSHAEVFAGWGQKASQKVFSSLKHIS